MYKKLFVCWQNLFPLTSQGNITLEHVMACVCCTFLCELLSFTEQTVEDGAEVTEQPLAVLQQLHGLRVGEVGRAVKQRGTWGTKTQEELMYNKNVQKQNSKQHRNRMD